MSRFYILSTAAQRDECVAECVAAQAEAHKENPDYLKGTTAWWRDQTRFTDGKFIVKECEYLIEHSYLVEESQPDWFEVIE